MRHLFLLKNSKIKFTHTKEIRPIPIQIFILTRYKKNLYLQSDLQTIREGRDNKQIQGLDAGDAAALRWRQWPPTSHILLQPTTTDLPPS